MPMLYVALSRRHGLTKIDKISEKEQSAVNKVSISIIFIQVLLLAYMTAYGVVVGDYIDNSDIVALVVIGVSCLCSFFSCLLFLSTYDWNRLGKV